MSESDNPSSRPSSRISGRAASSPANTGAAEAYFDAVIEMLQTLRRTQLAAIEAAAEICADTIARRGLVHLFGTGHSRIMIEEIFPRHGSFPGFHPIVELSLTYHNQVVGSNGQRQAMYLEHVEGLGAVILRNFVLRVPDSFIVVSNSGVNEVVVEIALEAKDRGLPVIALISKTHCEAAEAVHSSGMKLTDVADVVLDNGSPGGDALVHVDGLEDPVGPASTVGGAAVVNALKCRVAEKLAERGHPPIVLTSGYFIGRSASRERFEVCYDDYRDRVRRAYGYESGEAHAGSESGGDSPKSGGDSPKPGVGSPKSGGDSPKPGGDSPNSSRDSLRSTDESPKSSGESPKWSGDSPEADGDSGSAINSLKGSEEATENG